jgi:rhodanese-related sulfurtransferase
MAMTGREMIEAARRVVPGLDRDALGAQLQGAEGVVVLDVRERAEWDDGHIPQATWLARGFIEGRMEETVPDKNTPIVTH